jgi:hypothetical protein
MYVILCISQCLIRIFCQTTECKFHKYANFPYVLQWFTNIFTNVSLSFIIHDWTLQTLGLKLWQTYQSLSMLTNAYWFFLINLKKKLIINFVYLIIVENLRSAMVFVFNFCLNFTEFWSLSSLSEPDKRVLKNI